MTAVMPVKRTRRRHITRKELSKALRSDQTVTLRCLGFSVPCYISAMFWEERFTRLTSITFTLVSNGTPRRTRIPKRRKK